MNILHVIPDLSPAAGGPVTAIKGMALHQGKIGHSVTIVAAKRRTESRSEVSGVAVHQFDTKVNSWRWAPELSPALRSLALAADIVHVHMMWEHSTWAAARICRRLGKPYVLRPCGMLEHWSLTQSPLRKRAYLTLMGDSIIKEAAAIHFTSEVERTNSAAVCGGRPSFVVPLGIDLTAHETGSSRMSLLFDRFPELRSRKIVLFLGRVHPKKRPDLLIKAFASCQIDSLDTCLAIAGPGAPGYLQELEQLARKLRICERVFFLGLLGPLLAREAYRAASVFVLPSHQENFGIAAAEALAAGCPVIVSEHVALAKDIAEAEAGIVSTTDVASLATAIVSIMTNPPLREMMAGNGRRLIRARYSWPAVVRQLGFAYHEALLSKNAPGDRLMRPMSRPPQ